MSVQYILNIGIFTVTLCAMEAYAWFMHRYVMHGILWSWHKSHHAPRPGRFERNDLFAVVFSLPAIVCIALGTRGSSWLLAIGLGITAYGFIYAVFHDGLVHRRFKTVINPQSRFWKPRIQAHRIHHAVHTKDGCVSFGFLIVQPVSTLKVQLAALRQRSSGSPAVPRHGA